MNALRLCAALLLLAAYGTASAHTRSQSFSSWSADGTTLTGIYMVGAQRVTQLGAATTLDELEDRLATHLLDTVHVSQGVGECRARSPRPLTAARGDIRVELVFDCPGALADAPAKVLLGAFFDVSPSHVHYARIAREGGQAQEVLVTDRSRAFVVGGQVRTFVWRAD